MAQDRLTRQQRRQIRELIATHDPLIQAAFIQAINTAKGALLIFRAIASGRK